MPYLFIILKNEGAFRRSGSVAPTAVWSPDCLDLSSCPQVRKLGSTGLARPKTLKCVVLLDPLTVRAAGERARIIRDGSMTTESALGWKRGKRWQERERERFGTSDRERHGRRALDFGRLNTWPTSGFPETHEWEMLFVSSPTRGGPHSQSGHLGSFALYENYYPTISPSPSPCQTPTKRFAIGNCDFSF